MKANPAVSVKSRPTAIDQSSSEDLISFNTPASSPSHAQQEQPTTPKDRETDPFVHVARIRNANILKAVAARRAASDTRPVRIDDAESFQRSSEKLRLKAAGNVGGTNTLKLESGGGLDHAQIDMSRSHSSAPFRTRAERNINAGQHDDPGDDDEQVEYPSLHQDQPHHPVAMGAASVIEEEDEDDLYNLSGDEGDTNRRPHPSAPAQPPLVTTPAPPVFSAAPARRRPYAPQIGPDSPRPAVADQRSTSTTSARGPVSQSQPNFSDQAGATNQDHDVLREYSANTVSLRTNNTLVGAQGARSTEKRSEHPPANVSPQAGTREYDIDQFTDREMDEHRRRAIEKGKVVLADMGYDIGHISQVSNREVKKSRADLYNEARVILASIDHDTRAPEIVEAQQDQPLQASLLQRSTKQGIDSGAELGDGASDARVQSQKVPTALKSRAASQKSETLPYQSEGSVPDPASASPTGANALADDTLAAGTPAARNSPSLDRSLASTTSDPPDDGHNRSRTILVSASSHRRITKQVLQDFFRKSFKGSVPLYDGVCDVIEHDFSGENPSRFILRHPRQVAAAQDYYNDQYHDKIYGIIKIERPRPLVVRASRNLSPARKHDEQLATHHGSHSSLDVPLLESPVNDSGTHLRSEREVTPQLPIPGSFTSGSSRQAPDNFEQSQPRPASSRVMKPVPTWPAALGLISASPLLTDGLPSFYPIENWFVSLHTFGTAFFNGKSVDQMTEGEDHWKLLNYYANHARTSLQHDDLLLDMYDNEHFRKREDASLEAHYVVLHELVCRLQDGAELGEREHRWWRVYCAWAKAMYGVRDSF